MTFNFKFSRLFSKNRHPGKLNCTFLPQNLTRLFPLKEVRPLPIASMIKFVTFDIKTQQHSR